MRNPWFAWRGLGVVAVLAFGGGCGGPGGPPVLAGPQIQIEWNELLHTRVSAVAGGEATLLGPYAASETVTTASGAVGDFQLTASETQTVQDAFGAGHRVRVTGSAGALQKTVEATVYEEFPSVAVFEVEYANEGDGDLEIQSWTSHGYRLEAPAGSPEPAFWSYQSGSYQNRPDWVLPLKPGFTQDNFQGMNASDYGGGTPVSDVWSRLAGLAVGHLELVPKQVLLPVDMASAGNASVGVRYEVRQTLKPGETLRTFRTFAAAHHGDYFSALREYRRLMTKQGVRLPQSPADAFEPIWCAWGYRRDVTPRQIYGTLPIVKKLGFRWVGVDDGWQTAEGDWYLDPKKFPRGDADMRAIVDRVHAEGFRAQLWWAPLAVDPGTDLIEQHPDYLLLNQDGSRQDISWWNSFYLCPAYKPVQENAKALVTKMFRDWDYDGLKLDGQHLNGAPPCYNPAHHHARPEESVEAVPEFFKTIYDTALSFQPDALVELCPCGTAYSFFTLPYLNMAVASDPESSWQIRTKAKTLKALMGDSIAYFGDHVELSDGRQDFASTVGVGGVVGTEFTWPAGASKNARNDLTPEREQIWSRWIGIYREKMLSRGEYLGGLYDIGFDRPEAHAIRKDGSLYYAFYAPEWEGEVELRGLQERAYRVSDYVRGVELGNVTGPAGRLAVKFEGSLLLEARPE
jgi:alpha-galactosidase